MAEERVQRRLAAIVAADVVGYSRLMGRDEAGTLARLKNLRTEFLHPKVAEHGGRIVKTTGDGTLIEFASAVDAVRHAADVQRGMAERNARLPKHERIHLRLGINVGDIIIDDDDDIYGDGVNVAARLEALAEPGGICISARVHDYVRGRLDVEFDDLGERTLKNIAEPIRVFRVRLDDTPPGSPAEHRGARTVPDRPSIAVLPFDNMSGDPDQEYFADGITEDIITLLSRIRQFDVIARNTVFTFKGKAVDLRQASDQLGAQYVVEGSVRKAGNRVRVTAQLIEGQTGNHVWAERYDRDLDDIFAIQDEITNEIVVALQVELSEGEQARLRHGQTGSVAAWDCYVRGLSEHRRSTREGVTNARELFEKAVALDPEFGAAWVLLGRVHWVEARASWSDDPTAAMDRAAQCAEKSLAINDLNPEGHALVGMIRVYQRRFEEAIAEGRRAIDLGPNMGENYVTLAQTMNYVGRPKEAAALVKKAMRLSRFHPDYHLGVLANSYRMLGRSEEAIELDSERLKRNPDNFYSDFRLAALYMELGREEEARQHVVDSIAKHPNISLRQIRTSEPYEDENYLVSYLDLLRQAGMPE